ncbi:hypothetical protein [Arthrobacter castelli]|uniref:hypothetical protein n=1 Tax=Arthrobacter castelli TaxID=271431 RepID=UPI0012DEAC62|nr:hypothetical protein [Arthrobacter castelli]
MTTPDQQPPHQPGQGHGEVAAAGAMPSRPGKASGRSQLAFAAVGLGVGLITGLALGQLEFAQPSNAIPEAVESCGVQDTAGINVGDGGQSISMQSEGTESAGAAYVDVACVLMELETTDSVISKIDSTRALDGRMTGQWGEFSASWGYHPDSGLDIVIEVVETD